MDDIGMINPLNVEHEVMNFVGPLCDYMPTELQADCDTFVKSLPSLMTMLAEDVLLDSTCSELGFCNKTRRPETPVDALPEVIDQLGWQLQGVIEQLVPQIQVFIDQLRPQIQGVFGGGQGGGLPDLGGNFGGGRGGGMPDLMGGMFGGGQGGGIPDLSGIFGGGGQGRGMPDWTALLGGSQGGGMPDRTGMLGGGQGGGMPDLIGVLAEALGVGQGRGMPDLTGALGGGRGGIQFPAIPSIGQGRPNPQNPRQEPQRPQQGRPGFGRGQPGNGGGIPSNGGSPGNGKPQYPSPNTNPRLQKPRPSKPKPAEKPTKQDPFGLGDIMSGILDQLPGVQAQIPKVQVPQVSQFSWDNLFGGRKRRAVPNDFPKGFKDKVQDMLPELLPQKDKIVHHEYIPDPLPDAGITIMEQIPGMTGTEECEMCKLAVVAVDNWLTDNAPQLQKLVSQFVLPFCTVFPSPMKEDCATDVSDFVQTFIQVLVSKLQPEPICTWLGKCDANMGPIVPDVPLLPTETPRVEPGTTWPMFP